MNHHKILKSMTNLIKKLSLIDVILLFIGIIFVLIIFLFFKRDINMISVRFKVTDENPLYAYSYPRDDFAAAFVNGDYEKDEMGNIIAQIENAETYSIENDKKVVYLNLKLKAVHNPRKNIYTYRGKPLVFGENHTFTFSKVKVTALVVDFPGYQENIQYEKTIVKTQLRNDSREYSDTYGVSSFVADAVKNGAAIKDFKGNIMAVVKEIKVVPAKRTIIKSNGVVISTIDPELKDVFYTLELTTWIRNGKRYMFDNIPVVIGNSVPLNFSNISVFPIITSIEK